VADDAPLAELCGAPANASVECLPTGSCAITGCSGGWQNVDGAYTNGCECAEEASEVGATGDTCGSFLDVGDLSEGAAQLRTGNIAAIGDSDWYHFRAVDGSPASGGDNYYVRAYFTANPDGLFVLDVRRGGCGSNLCQEISDFTWATDMNAAPPNTQLIDPVAVGSAPAGEGNCVASPGDANRNICNDDSADYYVRVYRLPGAPATCANYTIEVSNAKYSTP
jgi:hypothetical protein